MAKSLATRPGHLHAASALENFPCRSSPPLRQNALLRLGALCRHNRRRRLFCHVSIWRDDTIAPRYCWHFVALRSYDFIAMPRHDDVDDRLCARSFDHRRRRALSKPSASRPRRDDGYAQR